MSKSITKDMTAGAITPMLIEFTIPLILGNLLQLTYNAADSAIVGQFVGEQALAAIGISSPIVTACILFINGLCMGASVIMSTMFGAKDMKGLKREISTTMVCGLIFALVVSLLCVIFTPQILTAIKTPSDVMKDGITYLRIYFLGMVFTFVYNFYSSTLRALGDSKSPLYFLALSSALNVVGDLIFVICFHSGVEGCAISTVLSEAICCVLCSIYVKRKIDILRLGREWLVVDKELLFKTISYGWATATQQAVVPFGKILCQTMINTLGTSAVAAVAATSRLDDFAILPMQNISFAVTAFMAQNIGAKKYDRVKKGFKEGLMLNFAYAVIVVIACLVAAGPMVSFFTSDDKVIELGIMYMKVMAMFYLMPAYTNSMQGLFRAFGKMRQTLFATISNIGGRVVSLYILMFVLGLELVAVPLSFAVGWIVMIAYETPIMLRQYKKIPSE